MDNQVLPALRANAGANNPPEYAPGEEFNEEEAKNGEPISADKRSIAQPLIDAFGEPVIRMIFSRFISALQDNEIFLWSIILFFSLSMF